LYSFGGELNRPRGLCIHEDSENEFDQIIVADYSRHCICFFDRFGAFLGQFGLKGDTTDEDEKDSLFLKFPTGLCLSYHGIKPPPDCWMSIRSDETEKKDEVIEDELEPQLFIMDSSNHRIVAVTLHGILRRSWGEFGLEDGNFYVPVAITENPFDHTLYVTDPGAKRVSCFSRHGDLLKTIKITIPTPSSSEPSLKIGQLNYLCFPPLNSF
jgi:hypothetical protein